MIFTINDIPFTLEKSMIETSVWTNKCPLNIDRLKLLEVSHYDFNNRISIGHLVVLDKVAQAVINIFEELLRLKFPIYSLRTIDKFNGNDELSMQENNSSAFNFRPIMGTNILSMHSYGLAIDINPLQNPYLITKAGQASRLFKESKQNNKNKNVIEDKKTMILPSAGKKFLDRTIKHKGMVEPIVPIFKKHGFSQWGGNWNSPIDYQHFQVPRNQVENLCAQTELIT